VVKIYLDSGSLEDIRRYGSKVEGFTTNPSLMKAAGITNYLSFAEKALYAAADKPISMEVISDDFHAMEKQARALASLGNSVIVKIPVTNTKGESCIPLIKDLRDVRLNITAVMTREQIDALGEVDSQLNIVSIFAGRIADTGRDPEWTMLHAKGVIKKSLRLWASAREILNVSQAEECGCDIITLGPSLINKLDLHGKPLAEYSLETVRQFHEDGKGIQW